MKYAASVFVFLSIIPGPSQLSALQLSVPPKYEVRAVWLTTLGGMDWPRSHDKNEQKESLRRIVADLRSRNFNTIFFQVRPRGNALYESRYEPWAEELTGTAGKSPGWDPLAYLLQEAHAAGLEVHAWLNIVKVYGSGRPHRSEPPHVLDAHPSWVKKCNGEWWLDMGVPEAREFCKKIAMDVALRYDVDGLHFDYLRYPERGMDDGESFRRYGGGRSREDWRRQNLNLFAAEVYRTIKKQKPHLKIGSAPIGIYRPLTPEQSDFTGYAGVYQDARTWLRLRVMDYIVPQLYWDLGNEGSKNDPDFGLMCKDWTGNAYGRHVYAGIGVYKKKIREEIDDQIVVSRQAGADGQAFFRYRHLEMIGNHFPAYRFPALIPPMPWIDSIRPLPPADVAVLPEGRLRWRRPQPAADGDMPDRYVIYRSSTRTTDIQDPRNIVAIVPGNETGFVDRQAGGKTNSYAVTALDFCNNESTPGVTNSPVAAAAVPASPKTIAKKAAPPEMPAAAAKELEVLKPAAVGCVLAQNYPEPFAEKTLILYEIDTACHVRLVVTSQSTGSERCVVDARQQPGTYVALFESIAGNDDRYECRLEAGGSVKKITMRKR